MRKTGSGPRPPFLVSFDNLEIVASAPPAADWRDLLPRTCGGDAEETVEHGADAVGEDRRDAPDEKCL